MDNILHGLNANQKAAVTSSASVLQVLAPPGSGKTKTLTARVAYLIAHQQLKPWNIITCTFTRKAANEMKERIRNFVGEDLAKHIKLGTFHAIAVQYLRQYGQHIGLEKDFGIADASDSRAILKRIIKKNKFTMEPSSALGRISAQKVRGVDSEQLALKAKHVEQQEFAQIFAEYESELKASNLLDYDDLLLRCCLLMRTHPQCVSNVEAVLIDEFQDTNTTQYELMSLFAQQRNAITIVGDPDQSIYSFRYAEIQNLSRMKQHWPDTLTINLQENYRSSGAILHAAQNIIEQDETRPPKKLQATHSVGLRPVLRKLPTAAAEASWLVSEIKRMCALSGDVLKPDDVAILLRSASLSRVIEAALGKEGVAYRMVGGVKFFDRVEVKLVLDYLRVIDQPNNNEAVERIINVPSRRIGDAAMNGLLGEAKSKGTSLWTLVCDISQGRHRPATKLTPGAEKGLSSFVNVILSGQRRMASSDAEQGSVVDLINLIVKKIDLPTWLRNKFENEDEARWANIEELMAQAADVSDPQRLQAMMEEQSLPSIDGFEQRESSGEDALSLFLANVALSASVEEKSKEGAEPVPQVTISTIHSAKGLEWPVVFIPGCFEGSIPHSRSGDNDEERRLLYVGMTRAQAMLYLSCPIKNTQREDTTMSCYLTYPGASTFFDERGPNMDLASANSLATTLKREKVSETAYRERQSDLERDKDDYWPLDGEEPVEERARWDYGKTINPLPTFGNKRPATWMNASFITTDGQGLPTSTTPHMGFVSVKDNYDELIEKSKLNAIDKRAKANQKQAAIEGPRGRKRQIEGQGSISNFFNKRKEVASDRPHHLHERDSTPESTNALRDTPNQANVVKIQPSSHKLRAAPLRSLASARTPAPSVDNDYVFLSSSPTKPGDNENRFADTGDTTDIDDTTSKPLADFSGFTPAITFHQTSMQAVQQAAAPPTRGKRYGVRPSFNGWANRGRR